MPTAHPMTADFYYVAAESGQAEGPFTSVNDAAKVARTHDPDAERRFVYVASCQITPGPLRRLSWPSRRPGMVWP